ncbi:MAG: iron ABC transporter permease [Oscillospiraceae bacterium]
MKSGNIRRKTKVTAAISLLLLAVLAIFAIGIGSVYLPPETVLQVLFGRVDSSYPSYIIVWNMRLSRVLASMFEGAALSISGLILQISVQNPIADPYILGISSGARLAVGMMLLGGVMAGFHVTNPWILFLGALSGALAVMALMLLFSARVRSVTTLLIVGMMIGYFCSALVGLLVAFSDDSSIADFTRWTMGSFRTDDLAENLCAGSVCSCSFALSFLLGKNLNALRMGEAYAVTMGVNTKALRVAIILISGLLTAVVTAFAGPASFIGMSVPHICRMILRTDDSRALIPSCILCGGIFGVGCDLISRTIIAPNELAIGTVTAYVGVPIVLYLLMKKNRHE